MLDVGHTIFIYGRWGLAMSVLTTIYARYARPCAGLPPADPARHAHQGQRCPRWPEAFATFVEGGQAWEVGISNVPAERPGQERSAHRSSEI